MHAAPSASQRRRSLPAALQSQQRARARHARSPLSLSPDLRSHRISPLARRPRLVRPRAQVLVDRRKFLNTGWNIPYDFNDSDFDVSELCLSLYIDEYDATPWDALKYLISEINYGGRVTDDWDRRLMNVYMNAFFNDDALTTPNFKLSSLPQYFIPDDGSLQSYREFCATLPGLDHPEAFGQHPNADIASQISQGNEMLDTIVSLQPRTAESVGGMGPEARVFEIASDLANLVPEPFDIHGLLQEQLEEPTPLVTVLLQEMQRYNAVLTKIAGSLANLKKAIRGLVVMSAELEIVFNALLEGKVPGTWLSAYPSLKPLAAWSRDLLQRIAQLQTWAEQGTPKTFWLTGFTYPTGFLTALMQTSARKNNVSIDTLAWDFVVVNLDEKDIVQAPKEGAYIRGLWLEGAGWNYEQSYLCEPEQMELVYSMPIIQFKPVEARARRSGRGVYQCPLYMYPLRTGSRERPSFMITVDLKSGQSTEAEHWVKRGTALLLALDR
jgi:dynein heavy chain